MGKNSKNLTEDTRIIMGDISIGDYRNYFLHILGKEFLNNLSGMDFQSWLNTQVGKTLKKAVWDYLNPSGTKNMEELLKEERFNYVSKENKKFIIEFTKQMNSIDYDFGRSIGDGFCWGHNMIIYSQKKKVIARIFIRDKGVRMWGGNEYKWNNSIVLRLFFNNIDKHIDFIEIASSHIKLPFIDNQGLCNHCGGKSPIGKKCHNRKNYMINGEEKEKCGYVFSYTDPKIEHLMDYVNILKEFYVKKNEKSKKQKTGT